MGIEGIENAHKAAERVARERYGRLLAFLAARTRDVAGAEDALADAFASALRTWPDRGVPANPDAWILTAARHRQTDAARRRQTREISEEHLQLMAEEIEQASRTSEEIPDRRLALMFTCAHPAIEARMRAPLMLQTILGLTAEAIYAAYSEGWAEIGGDGNSPLAEEAIWLGRLVVSLLPDEPEAKGMLALMLFAEALLHQANASGPSGRYQIEAAIQSAHTARRVSGRDTRRAILALYDHLLARTGSPVAALNRAVAQAAVEGAAAALDRMGPLASDKRMHGYQPYWAVRGHLLAEAGRKAEAHEALTVAMGLSTDEAIRRYLEGKREALAI
jgi:RNA polymerase sigma-70 factor, ECF subfamily